jgi:hypothetical protein
MVLRENCARKGGGRSLPFGTRRSTSHPPPPPTTRQNGHRSFKHACGHRGAAGGCSCAAHTPTSHPTARANGGLPSPRPTLFAQRAGLSFGNPPFACYPIKQAPPAPPHRATTQPPRAPTPQQKKPSKKASAGLYCSSSWFLPIKLPHFYIQCFSLLPLTSFGRILR